MHLTQKRLGAVATAAAIVLAALLTVAGCGDESSDSRPDELRNATSGWNTDWQKHSVPYEELLAGGPPRDGIPSIDEPAFISTGEASAWLADNEPVIALELDGDARAYPLQILIWHEIVNDEVGGTPAVVTFCPLCNAALAFDRSLDGQIYEFGTSGLLRNSDLVMYDRSSESLWQQFTGEAIAGELTGKTLRFLPARIVSFGDFRQAWPQGLVLSRDTGYDREYGTNPYVGYDDVSQSPFLFQGDTDDRLPAMERVVAVEVDGMDIAYPFSAVTAAGVINDSQAGQDLVIFHEGGTVSALDQRVISESADIGSTGVFKPVVEGRKLTFTRQRDGDGFVDAETGSSWNILGQATDGPLAGARLEPLIHADHFWFAWAAFKPDTIIYGAGSP